MSIKKPVSIIVCMLLVAPLAAETSAKRRYKERTTQLAPGVSYTVIRDNSGPFRIRYVSVDLAAGATLDTVLSNEKLPKFETTTSMAQRTGSIAAINGDYARDSGRPVFTFASDGNLAQTPLAWGRNFATTYDESATYIGHPEVTGWATEEDAGATYPVTRVNYMDEPLTTDEVRLFTDVGGGVARAPDGHCLVRVMPLEPPYIAETQPGVDQAFQVERVDCDGGRGFRAQGGAILASRLDGQYAFQLASMTIGEELKIGWSMTWPNVLDTVGGNPTLIEAGAIVLANTQGTGAFFSRHPRTGVGTTPDGRVLLVTVDGRQPGYSVGMTLQEFAELFARLGADWALNLDGGGSTALAINGALVNRPSDGYSPKTPGHERAVSSALVVLPGTDPGEVPQPRPSPSSLVPFNTSDASYEIASDPASTGGMLDAMARQGYLLPAPLLRTLAIYRSGR